MRRATGFPRIVKDIVWARSGNRCEVCNRYTHDLQYHHRRPRQAGGSRLPDTNTASNCLLLCLADHNNIESHRRVAYENGHLVRSGKSPAAQKVLYRGRWAKLDDEGGITYLEEP